LILPLLGSGIVALNHVEARSLPHLIIASNDDCFNGPMTIPHKRTIVLFSLYFAVDASDKQTGSKPHRATDAAPPMPSGRQGSHA
jgi:hypothetical protein